MTKPKFNNRENPHFIHKVFEGNNKLVVNHNFWLSRAPAVVGIIFATGIEGGAHVLVIRRSKNMREEPLKYGAPSGYLDWDESGFDAMTREVYEETSMYLPDYKDFLIFDNDEQPFYVQSDPEKDKNQNVSLIYLMAYNFIDHQNFFPDFIEKHADRETAEVKWMSLTEFYNQSSNWAFHHDARIISACEYLLKKKVKLI
ncbi:MAG: NUDIX hydrolase [Bacteroidales bacterium]|jgi:ADP-ribose pyrophosphatase YjhB (NUDIX family)|nr:NUDIX hydrolase [Bacteroidales bacterium]